MEAKDLRIGNLIFDTYTKENKFIAGIFDNEIWLSSNNEESDQRSNISSLQPIPLTKKILSKCGFDFKEPILTSAWKFSSARDIIRTKCEYLHQLQNLYFALTNEELIIKL